MAVTALPAQRLDVPRVVDFRPSATNPVVPGSG